MTQAHPNTAESGASTLQRWRVPLGFISAILYRRSPAARAGCCCSLGSRSPSPASLVRAWASGHLRKNRELATDGPYAFTRNPLYFGSFLLVLGFSIGGGSCRLGLWLVTFFGLIYWPVIQTEAAHIGQLFGDDYRAWASRVPLFFPRFSPGSRNRPVIAKQEFRPATISRITVNTG
jgi:hypothetical protein